MPSFNQQLWLKATCNFLCLISAGVTAAASAPLPTLRSAIKCFSLMIFLDLIELLANPLHLLMHGFKMHIKKKKNKLMEIHFMLMSRVHRQKAPNDILSVIYERREAAAAASCCSDRRGSDQDRQRTLPEQEEDVTDESTVINTHQPTSNMKHRSHSHVWVVIDFFFLFLTQMPNEQ